jgi:hypothetical protein
MSLSVLFISISVVTIHPVPDFDTDADSGTVLRSRLPEHARGETR